MIWLKKILKKENNMAFKMKGPSLLKMVKQMKEGSPAKQKPLGTSQTNKNKEEAAKSIRDASKQTMEVNEKLGKQFLGETVDAMQKQENTQTGDLTYTGGSFDQAFADAKKSGAGVFTYDGKKYRTQTKKDKEMDDALSKLPKKKIQPLPVKDDAKIIKAKKDRPDPTFEGTDEFRSLDEIRSASRK
tara:strand:- start:1998 stop:2558 length:561 start_codon:yes stop_codon:yes gene_type:complete